MVKLIIAAVLTLSIHLTLAFPRGAPPDACSTNLAPIHGGNQAQPTSGPYTLVASSRTYSPNKPITVVLKGSGQTFKGFMIQAQDLHTGQPIVSGEWRGSGAKQLPCAAVTHTGPNSKSKVEVTWTPKGTGEVVFMATVVERFDTFYTGIKSSARSTSGAANSFYDRDQKTRGSSTYPTSVRGSSSNQGAYPSSASDGTSGIYDSPSTSQQKEDDEDTADTQDQYDSNYYGNYNPNSGYSQPDFSAASSSVSETQQNQPGYYANPNYQFQSPSHQFQSPYRPQHSHGPQPFASFQSPSYHSQRFAHPNYRQPFQQFQAPWNYPRY